MKKNLDIEAQYLHIIARILSEHLPSNTKIFFFGSRTTGHAKPFSDIDILIDAGIPLSLAQLSSLNTAFEESLLPYKVDIVDARTMSKEFKRVIYEQLIPF